MAAPFVRSTDLLAADERSLRDMGLTRYDALYEAHKRFWRA
jgi:uncharacterized protein YjiS (DUF1127 family)